MSKQLSFSASFCAIAMMLFALTAQAEVPTYENGATVGAAAPIFMPLEAIN